MLRQLVVFWTLLACPVLTYKSGAPMSRCGDMTPKHHTVPQTSPAPYRVSVEPKQIRPGEKITVKLSSPEGRMFKGFLAQTRKKETNETVGHFEEGSNIFQAIDCFELTKSAITHTNNVEKSEVIASWVSPRDFNGEVVIWSSFVENGKTFWVNVTSEDQVSVSGAPVELNQQVTNPYQSVYDGCYQTKGCFGVPGGCVASRDCKRMITYIARNTTVDFEMIGETRGWIAVGFSWDDKMGSDAVTACALNGSNDRVSVFQSWNIAEGYNNQALDDLHQGLSNMKTSYENGFILCQFTHQAIHTILKTNNFNLINDSYFLFLGGGYMESVSNPVQIARHVQNPYISASAAHLTDVSEIGVASDLLIRLHGSLMITAWIGTVSVAIFLARYFKQMWPTTKHCGEKVWFTWHRALNITSVLLTIAGFVLIFIQLNGWSQVWKINPHPIMGVIVTGLVIIQPIMAAFRCHPGTKNRPIFNWLHFLVGNSAHVLAIITLFFAKTLSKSKLPYFYMWILIAFVAFHVVIFLIMEAYTCFHGNKVRDTQIALKDMSASNGNAFALNDVTKDVGSRFRKFLLLIYAFGNIGFVIALIVTVFMSPVKER